MSTRAPAQLPHNATWKASIAMPTLDRMREKHNALTMQLAKQQAKRDKAIAVLIRADAKLGSVIRAVARSAKRLDKAVAAATHTAGPTATVKPALIEKVAGKPVPTFKVDDVPSLARERPRGHADLADFANTFGPAVRESLEDSRKADAAKAKRKPMPLKQQVKELSEIADALAGKPRRKSRRTPDDFKADMDARKGD